MTLKSERGWKILLFGLIATIIIWTLGNLTPVLFDLFLEGEISHTTQVAFLMGLYGVISGGLISILSEKVGFLGASDFAKGQQALAEVSGVAAKQIEETPEQRATREVVEARKERIPIEEYRAIKKAELEAKTEDIKTPTPETAVVSEPEPIPATPVPVVPTPEPTPVPPAVEPTP